MQNKPIILAASVISAICSNMFLMLPLIAAAAHSALNLTLEETGILGSNFFGGYVLGSLLALWLVPRYNWRKLSTLLTAIYALSFYVAGYFSYDVQLLGNALLFAGFIAGILYSIATCSCADQPNADSAFGARLFAEQVLAGVLLFSLPLLLIVEASLGAIFNILATVYLLGLLVTKFLPTQSLKTTIKNTLSMKASLPLVSMKLLTFAIYFAGLSGVWAFIEILGQDWGYRDGAITQLLSLGVLGGAVGALIATVQGDRWGKGLPHIVAGLFMFLILLIFMMGEANALTTAAVVILPGVWNYLLAYQLGQLANLDKSGKLAPYFTPMLGFGAALGPLAGGMVADAYGMNTFILITIIFTLLGTLGFIYKSSQ